MFEVSDTQKIGMGLLGFGTTFLFLGVLFFFDNALLAMGNVMFVSGVSLLIGLNNAGKFFFGANLKSSAMFFGGIFIVLIGYSIIGMLVESVGLFYLFSGFIPRIVPLLRSIPVVNSIFLIPGLNRLLDSLSTSKLPV